MGLGCLHYCAMWNNWDAPLQAAQPPGEVEADSTKSSGL